MKNRSLSKSQQLMALNQMLRTMDADLVESLTLEQINHPGAMNELIEEYLVYDKLTSDEIDDCHNFNAATLIHYQNMSRIDRIKYVREITNANLKGAVRAIDFCGDSEIMALSYATLLTYEYADQYHARQWLKEEFRG